MSALPIEPGTAAKADFCEPACQRPFSANLQDVRLWRRTRPRLQPRERVLARYRSRLMRSWTARAVGMFIAVSAAAISTSACRA